MILRRKLKMRMNETTFKFFEWVYENDSLPFLDSGETASRLDDDYYYSIAYSYTLSSMYENLIKDRGEDDGVKRVYEIILNRFKSKWEREYSALISEYDPTQNFSITEKENVGTNVTTEVATDNDVYGFNSETAVNSSDTKTTSATHSDKIENERELTRKGNDGKSFQESIDSEIYLRERWNLFQLIYKDISSVIASSYIR